MSDRLRELLDQKPTQGEVDYADTLADSLNWECVSGNPRPRMAQGRADHRLSLVRETMRECAKVMCKGCAKGLGMDGRYYHDDLGHHYECKAMPIHALLAETEDK